MADRSCADAGRGRENWRGAARRALRPLIPALLLAAAPARAQVESIATVAPVLSPVGIWRTAANAPGPGAMANSLTLRINSGAAQVIPSLTDNRINTFPSAVNITTAWQVAATVSVVDLVGYFSNPMAALSGPTYDIPSGRMNGRMLTGSATTFAPFDDAAVAGVGTPGATLHLSGSRSSPPSTAWGSGRTTWSCSWTFAGCPSCRAGRIAAP